MAGCSSARGSPSASRVALVIGFVCLRTSGMAFIMITLAFAQMIYFLAISLKTFGGDDGLTIAARSDFGLFTLATSNALYYAAFAVLLACLFACDRLVHSRFGMVLRGVRGNERRMAALGFPDAALQAHRVRHLRAGLRDRRHAARQPDQVRRAVVHGVAGIGRPHRDDHARRHGHRARAGRGRRRVAACSRRSWPAGRRTG